jgi:hypothetical protein
MLVPMKMSLYLREVIVAAAALIIEGVDHFPLPDRAALDHLLASSKKESQVQM